MAPGGHATHSPASLQRCPCPHQRPRTCTRPGQPNSASGTHRHAVHVLLVPFVAVLQKPVRLQGEGGTQRHAVQVCAASQGSVNSATRAWRRLIGLRGERRLGSATMHARLACSPPWRRPGSRKSQSRSWPASWARVPVAHGCGETQVVGTPARQPPAGVAQDQLKFFLARSARSHGSGEVGRTLNETVTT